MNSWKRIPIVDLCAAHVDCVNRTAPVVEGPTPYKMLRTTNVRNGYVDTRNVRYVTEEVYKRWTRRLVPKYGDVLLTREAPLGGVGKLRSDDNVFLGQRLYHFRPDPELLDSDFLVYSLMGHDLQSQIRGFGSGATVEHMRLEDIPKLEFLAPPIEIQKKISQVLSLYDELIENSEARIRILDAMARLLYKQALARDSKISLGPIIVSQYWTFISQNVQNYEGTKSYYATADFDGLTVLGEGINYTFLERPSRAQKQPAPNSVWFARMKDTYKIPWYGDINSYDANRQILSSGFAGFLANEQDFWPLLFLMISSEEFHVQKDLFCTGATQMSLTNEGLGRIEMPILGESSARNIGKSCKPLLDLMMTLQLRIKLLRRTRDYLLPCLISGKINFL